MKSFSCRRIMSISTDNRGWSKPLSFVSTECTAARSLPWSPSFSLKPISFCALHDVVEARRVASDHRTKGQRLLQRVAVGKFPGDLLDCGETIGRRLHRLIMGGDLL